METRPDRTALDAAQKAKMIFFAIAALVVILLIWSVVSAAKARTALQTAATEIEALKQDNAKLSTWLEERTRETETLKRQIEKLQAGSKSKQKATKTKSSAKSTAKKKSAKNR